MPEFRQRRGRPDTAASLERRVMHAGADAAIDDPRASTRLYAATLAALDRIVDGFPQALSADRQAAPASVLCRLVSSTQRQLLSLYQSMKATHGNGNYEAMPQPSEHRTTQETPLNADATTHGGEHRTDNAPHMTPRPPTKPKPPAAKPKRPIVSPNPRPANVTPESRSLSVQLIEPDTGAIVHRVCVSGAHDIRGDAIAAVNQLGIRFAEQYIAELGGRAAKP